MTKKPFLSVVIPSYNEVKNIKRNVLDDVYSYLKKQSYEWELLLSDDGSSDETPAYLADFAKKDSRIIVLNNAHAGKAPTVKKGMLAASGEWRLFTDFDQSTPISDVEKLMQFSKECDIVIGSREGDGSHREHEPIHRHVMGRIFNIIVQALTIPGIKDTQCGFKLFSEDATTKLFNSLYIYGGDEERQDAFTGAFDVELLYLAKKKGYCIKEIPINWKHAESDRVNPLKDSLRMLRDIFRIRIADIVGKYK